MISASMENTKERYAGRLGHVKSVAIFAKVLCAPH